MVNTFFSISKNFVAAYESKKTKIFYVINTNYASKMFSNNMSILKHKCWKTRIKTETGFCRFRALQCGKMQSVVVFFILLCGKSAIAKVH